LPCGNPDPFLAYKKLGSIKKSNQLQRAETKNDDDIARIFVGSNTLLKEDIQIDNVLNYQPEPENLSLEGVRSGSDSQIHLPRQASRGSNLRSGREIATGPNLQNLIPSSIIKKAGKSRLKDPANAKTENLAQGIYKMMQGIITLNKDGGGSARKSNLGSAKDVLANSTTPRGSVRSSKQSIDRERADSGPNANFSDLIEILPGSSLNPKLGTRITEENSRSPNKFPEHKPSIDDSEYSKNETIQKLSMNEPNITSVRDQARLFRNHRTKSLNRVFAGLRNSSRMGYDEDGKLLIKNLGIYDGRSPTN
jgi:hypothetical protein